MKKHSQHANKLKRQKKRPKSETGPDCSVKYENAFMSDVEGNLDQFDLYVSDPNFALKWKDENKKDELDFKCPKSKFIYGGDSQDKGIGDVKFVKMLYKLKAEQISRTQWIIGNRDLNKLRLLVELNEKCKEKLMNLNKEDESLQNFIQWDSNIEDSPKDIDKTDDKIKILEWILTKTMGAGGAFERRRHELAITKNKDKKDITDDDVQNSYVTENIPIANSFEDHINLENFMQQYIRYGKLLYQDFRTQTLQMHGGITKVESLGKVPGSEDMPVNNQSELRKWVDALNKWKDDQLNEQLNSYKNFDEKYCTNIKERPQAKLIDYGQPQLPIKQDGKGGMGQDQTVTYNDFWKEGEPEQLNEALVDKLVKLGVKNMVVGHKPHIDSPLVIKSPSPDGKQVQVVSADTSQSQFGATGDWGVNNRGDKTKSEVVVQENGVIRLHGQLADGKKQDFRLSDDPKIGTYIQGEAIDKDGNKVNVKWFQKAIVKENDESKQLLCWAKGTANGCKYSNE